MSLAFDPGDRFLHRFEDGGMGDPFQSFARRGIGEDDLPRRFRSIDSSLVNDPAERLNDGVVRPSSRGRHFLRYPVGVEGPGSPPRAASRPPCFSPEPMFPVTEHAHGASLPSALTTRPGSVYVRTVMNGGSFHPEIEGVTQMAGPR